MEISLEDHHPLLCGRVRDLCEILLFVSCSAQAISASHSWPWVWGWILTPPRIISFLLSLIDIMNGCGLLDQKQHDASFIIL